MYLKRIFVNHAVTRTADVVVTYVYAYLQFFVPEYDLNKNTLVKHCVVKAKFHYASWFDAGRRPASNQIA